MIRVIGQCVLIPVMHIWQRWYGKKHPICNRQIMFYAHRRRGIVCNPKYILEELMKDPCYKLYWVSEYPEKIQKDSHYEVVRYRSLKYFKLFVQTKVYITNDMLDELLYKRKGQIILGTWHGGGAYKKSGFSINPGRYQRFIFNLYYTRLDYVLSDSRLNTEIHSREFRVPQKQFLEFGLPRNDIFYKDNPNIRQKVTGFYGLPENIKILLYAPTYRKEKEGYKDYLTGDEMKIILKALEKRFGGKWVCIYRFHYFVREQSIPQNSGIQDGCLYENIQELLYSADAYITDYSAGMWDFSFTYRPIFLYTPDLEKYEDDDRGFYIPIDKWPYPYAGKAEELITTINEFDEKAYRKKLQAHHELFGMVQGGRAAEKTCNFIKKEMLREEKKQ